MSFRLEDLDAAFLTRTSGLYGDELCEKDDFKDKMNLPLPVRIQSMPLPENWRALYGETSNGRTNGVQVVAVDPISNLTSQNTVSAILWKDNKYINVEAYPKSVKKSRQGKELEKFKAIGFHRPEDFGLFRLAVELPAPIG